MQSPIHFDPRVGLGDIIHLIIIIAAVVGLALAGEQWKTTVELQMAHVTNAMLHQDQRVDVLANQYSGIDERLSRMEGKLDSIDRAVK